MDRQDIDALLVGALYGELTPAEEARLTVHLESHPADRGALDDLKSARAKVRESRIFDLQAEPPQHVSALLLQEAHRRAPKKVVADDGERRDSWFWRFARSFALHPAMAAAAMLVVVLGVSALVYKNKGADFANREVAPAATQSKAEDRAEMAPTTTATPSADQGMAAGSAAAPSEAYHAGLAEEQDLSKTDPSAGDGLGLDKNAESASERWRNDNEAEGKAAAPSPAKNKGIVVSTEQPQPKDLDGDDGRADVARQQLAKEQQAAQQKKTARKADSADETSLNFSGNADGYAPATGSTATGSTAPGRGANAGGGGAANGIVVGGAGPTAAPTTPQANHTYAQPPPPPPAADKANADAPKAPATKQEAKPDAKVTTAPSGGAGTATGAKGGGAGAKGGGATATKSPTSTTTTKSTSAPASDAKKVATQKPEKPAAEKPAAEKPAEEKTVAKAPPKQSAKSPAPQQAPAPPADPTVAWAKQQHARAVNLAKSGDCNAAAQVALAVSQKAPAYYASFMASDRELKSCKSYIDNARDREAEKSAKSRAQKRVNADEPAAPAENAK